MKRVKYHATKLDWSQTVTHSMKALILMKPSQLLSSFFPSNPSLQMPPDQCEECLPQCQTYRNYIHVSTTWISQARGRRQSLCRLIKCLYGTRQAGFKWYKILHEFFSKIRFTCSAVDHVVFYRHEGEHFSSAISVSMDNMAITGNLIKIINWIKGEFKKRFEISDLGEIK